MGLMQDNLIKILSSKNFNVTSGILHFPNINIIFNSKYKDEVMRIYKTLGGINDVFPANLRKWDLEFENIAIELDEYLHFNRYRKITLSSQIYNNISNFPLKEYSHYCDEYESNCLKAGSYGGKWTNNSCEKQFGKAFNKGDLSGNGSPRWKQRAFYDFVKDLSPLILNLPLVRISIWDEINVNNKRKKIINVLNECDYDALDSLINLIQLRNPIK